MTKNRQGSILSASDMRLPATVIHLYEIVTGMQELFINRISKKKQYFLSILAVCAVAGICYVFSGYIGYRVVALILLVTVSVIAVIFDIAPVFCGALTSALIWDYFFIPPRFTFHVDSTEDAILLIMYFIIAMVNAVLTYKIRQIEKVSRQREEKANTVKLYNTLLNSLSHELRTPIATIIGATDNLQNNDAKLSDHNKGELLAEISKASLRLNRQVDNLLNMSRLESGFIQPKKDWCDISEIIYAVVKRMEENNVTQDIRIQIDPDIPLFKSDKVLLEEIIYNPVHNAALYTEPDTVITISAAGEDNKLIITITDNGKGFPEAEIDKVFEKFYRVKYSVTGGTGLGLSIVKGFTEALDGNVVLKNTATGGAQFIITIPAETSYLKYKNE